MPSQFHLAGTVTGTSCNSLSALGVAEVGLGVRSKVEVDGSSE